MKLYNTLTKEKEDFKPEKNDEVRMYSCGPTVYSYAHIGNMRTYVFVDLLRRTLEYNGFKMKHAMNITDVGHLVSDADDGEDKVELAARAQNKDPFEITKHYSEVFFKDFDKLNIERPEIICKATDHIPDMIEYVKEIIADGYGYETSKGIYFDISKLQQYGILSGNNLEGQMAGARIEVDSEKRNPLDFALWIKAPENHLMKWESPWGLSYPGWHIECSAMSRKYLGEVFDIHTGGVDHIPIHHENEIAQSIGATGKIPSRFWIHGEFLLVDGGKMSKSLGNVYTISELQEKGYTPLAYRYFCLNSHYRNKLNFTFEGLEGAQTALKRLKEGVKVHLNGDDEISLDELQKYESDFNEAINDDLNMPKALGIVWDMIKSEKKSKQIFELANKFDKVLGLRLSELDEEKKEIELSEDAQKLIEARKLARANKDWAESDRLRDELKKMGIKVTDTANGMEIEM